VNVYTKNQNFLWQKIITKCIVLIIIIVLLNIFQSEVKSTFYYISSPAMTVFRNSGNNIHNFFQSFFNFSSFKKENDNLKEENQKLISEISSLQFYLRENQASKEALDNAKNANLNILAAHIVQLDTMNDYMTIDRGSKNGVIENMPVISSQQVIFGKVIKVYDNFSQVMLISNKSSVLDSKIQYDDPKKPLVHGVVKGNGDLSIYLDLVHPDSIVNEGDTLVTSGLEGTLPAGLIIGKVTSVNKDDLKPFLTADILPLFDAKTVDNVFIITNRKASS